VKHVPTVPRQAGEAAIFSDTKDVLRISDRNLLEFNAIANDCRVDCPSGTISVETARHCLACVTVVQLLPSRRKMSPVVLLIPHSAVPRLSSRWPVPDGTTLQRTEACSKGRSRSLFAIDI
jgi:hypothetical protein